MNHNKTRALLFGNYDAEYGRNRVIVKGMRENGAEVICCNGGTTGGVIKFARLFFEYFRIPDKRFDFTVVAFPAQETMIAVSPLLFFVRLFYRTPVIVDMLTSHYDGHILDRKKYSPQSFHAKWYRWLDRTAVRLADVALVDCYSAGEFFIKELGFPAHKFLTVFIGTDDNVMKPSLSPALRNNDCFLVHFHGTFIPHQGIETIIRAAHILKNKNISFRIIGRGQGYISYRKLAGDLGLSNIEWIDRVTYEGLPGFINKADVCLGPMGGSGHFDRCAPNKIYEYMACGKPVVVGHSKALDGIARDEINMLLVNPVDEHDLSEKILKLQKDQVLRNKLGENAREDFLNLYTPKRLVAGFFDNLQKRRLLPRKKEKTGILITGAGGFIGSRLSSFLSDQGYAVVKYTDDINNEFAMDNYFKTADYVIHLAAKVDEARKGREKDDFITVNVLGTQRVINLCLKHGCNLMFFSSQAARKPQGLYGLSKSLAEKLVQHYVEHRGLLAAIIRPHNIYDESKANRLGKHVDLSRGHNYPLANLLKDTERIIQDHNFTERCKIYETRLPISHYVLYWPRKILKKFRTHK